MTILTLSEIIKLDKGSQISGLTGLIKHIFEPKQQADPRNPNQQQTVQRVVLKDGKDEVWMTIYGTNTSKWIPASEKGKKLYAWPEPGAKGNPIGLRRGGDWQKSPTELNHFVELDGPGQWGFQEKVDEDFPAAPIVPAKPVEKPSDKPPETISPKLAVIVMRHRLCVEAALDTARTLGDQCEEISGEHFDSIAISAMADAIFKEANAQKVW